MRDAKRRAARPSVFDRVRLGMAGGSRLHVLMLWVMVGASAACGLAWRGDWGQAATIAFAGASGLALLLGRVARVAMLDWLLMASPRDNLLLFFAGGVVMIVPLLLGSNGWDYSLCALMLFLCPMAVHKWGTGRLVAVAGLLAISAMATAPPAPWPWVAVWLGATLMAMRIEAVVLRLEDHAQSAAVPMVTLARETLVAVVAPLGVGIGLLLWLGPAMLPHTRYLAFEATIAQDRLDQLAAPNINDLLLKTLMLVGMIGLLIAAIIWFEKQIGGRRSSGAAEPAHHLDASESRAFVPPDDEALPVDHTDDVRERILARFRRWLAVSEKIGHPRATSETPAELLSRFGRELDAALDADPAARALVERAAYSHLAMSDDDAVRFDRWAAAAEPTLREAAARRAAAKAAMGNKA